MYILRQHPQKVAHCFLLHSTLEVQVRHVHSEDVGL